MEGLENILTQLMDKTPYVALLVIIIWGCWWIYVKFGKCTACKTVDNLKEKLEFYQERFNKNDELKGVTKALKDGSEMLENLNIKLDAKIKEDREFFERIIAKDDKQNEVLAKLSTQIEMQTQLLLNQINQNNRR